MTADGAKGLWAPRRIGAGEGERTPLQSLDFLTWSPGDANLSFLPEVLFLRSACL
jgi:hypothetical protein